MFHTDGLGEKVMCPTVSVVVAGAGRGDRLGAAVPKAFVQLAGEPIVVHVLRRLARADLFGQAVIVVPETHVAVMQGLIAAAPSWFQRAVAIAGGAERQESVRRGLELLGDDCDVVVVHDAVRPFVSRELLVGCVEAARDCGAAVAALPVGDTLKRASGGLVTATVDREGLWVVQTPQAFRLQLLREAHRRAAETGYRGTDDAAVVERAGHPVRLVRGEPENFKITEPADLRYAERLLSARPVS